MPTKTAKTRFARKAPVRDLIITRVFDAPRETVWRHFTEPELVKRWWGPKGFTAPYARMDLRVGGESLLCMRAPDGKDYWSKGVYREVVPMERIVTTDSFADEKGNVVPATYYGMGSDFPLELLITMTFEEHDGRTKFTLKHSGFPPGRHKDDAQAGWNESFDKLEDSLGRAVLIKDESVRGLFAAYEKAFNALDFEKSAGFFTDSFISAGPRGAIAQSRAEFLRMAKQAADFYRSVGQTSAKIISADETPISDHYSVVKVHWGATFRKTGDRVIEFDVSYVVQKTGDEARIILFIAHQDEQAAMRELGLVSAKP